MPNKFPSGRFPTRACQPHAARRRSREAVQLVCLAVSLVVGWERHLWPQQTAHDAQENRGQNGASTPLLGGET
jgi:hypothetical protein